MAEKDEAADAWNKVNMVNMPVDDAMALLRKKPRTVSGTLEARRAREEQDLGPAIDGRRQRYKGRTEQLNVKVSPDFKKALARLAAANKSSMAEIIEFAVLKWERELADRPGGGV